MQNDHNPPPAFPPPPPPPATPQVVPVAPPTQPGVYLVPARAPAWPKVIGVIAIVLGAGGALGGLCGALMPWLQGALQSLLPPETAAGLMPFEKWRVPLAILQVATMLVAVLLLIGGIGLVSRKPWSKAVLLWWAGMRIPLVVGAVFMGILSQRGQMEYLQHQAAGPIPVNSIIRISQGIGLCVGLVWGWALPVFLIVWFFRRKVRDEVAQWSAAIVRRPGPVESESIAP